MIVNKLKKLIDQTNEENEITLSEVDLGHLLYSIWKMDNVRLKELDSNFTEYRKEKDRIDVFVNGDYILPKHYKIEFVNNDIHIKFIKDTIGIDISSSDVITVKGDVEER